MRLRQSVPVWLPPSVICVVAMAGFVALDQHFDSQVQLAGDAGLTAMAAANDVTAAPAPAAAILGSEEVAVEDDRSPAPIKEEVRPASAVLAAGQSTPKPPLWVDGASSGRPWSALGAIEGLLTFRGNPTRTFYGRGPVPSEPTVDWTYDIGCSVSPVAGVAKTWCGSGWTGQPSVFPSATTGEWQVAFGAYNRAVNFLDPETGDEALDPYFTSDIVKGSITVDPDGFPLLYTGSRDNHFHVVALDRETPTALWKLAADAVQPTLWNNDWDSSALVINDHLIVGGENGRFFIVKLGRGYDAEGKVTVAPEIVFTTESWDGELLTSIGDLQVSVENSVAIWGNVVYFTNSGGLVQGWDIGGLTDGEEPTQVFRYWSGDDTDASIVIDEEGMLYLGSQYERGNQRSRDIGQVIKLDPSVPDDPLVWSREANEGLGSGVWATPALSDELLIVATNGGFVLGLDRETGVEHWRLELQGPLWSSPVVVDSSLVQADCGGNLNVFDLDGQAEPVLRWSLALGGCLESTPAVWDGQIFIGSRNGKFYAVGECETRGQQRCDDGIVTADEQSQ